MTPFFLLIPITKAAETTTVSLGLSQQIANFYQWALGIGGLIALGILVFGGILYTASAGNVSKQDDAKQWIIGAFVGLLILFGSWFILNTINPELTKLTDLRLLVNKAAENISESGGGSSPYPVIDGQTCPVAPGFTMGGGCGAPRPQGGAGPGGHQGVDLMGQLGSPLYAIEDGVIAGNWGWNYYGGWRFWLYADSGSKYYYAHTLSKEALPPLGKRFKAGDLIGYLGESGQGPEGTTGNVGGPHLHLGFQAKTGGPPCGDPSYTDPLPLIQAVCYNSPSPNGADNTALSQVLNKSEYSGFGVVFREIGGAESASLDTGTSFPIASLYKLFVAEDLYQLRSEGKLNFGDKVIRLVDVVNQLKENSQDGTPASIWSSPPKEGQLVSVNDCLAKMITWSDNVCGKALRNFVLSKTLSSPSGLSEFNANQIAEKLTAIAAGKMVNQASSNELYNLLRQQHHTGKIPQGVPSGAIVANKTGELHGSNYSHDAAIIKYNGKTYILVILTHLDPDTPSTNRTIRQLTSELFRALK